MSERFWRRDEWGNKKGRAMCRIRRDYCVHLNCNCNLCPIKNPRITKKNVEFWDKFGKEIILKEDYE